MTLIQRLLCCTLTLGLVSAFAQTNSQRLPQSNLTGELLYQILLGEMQVLHGDAGAGYSLLLDAARKSSDEALYERAVEVALRARAGEASLRAASAWWQAFPQSRQANQRVLQIQVALQRLKEAQPVLRQGLYLAPEQERGELMLSIPGLLGRANDKALAVQVTEQALADWLESPVLGAQAWTAIGQMRGQNKDLNGALQAALRGAALNPKRSDPIGLGIKLARTLPAARSWVPQALAQSDDPALHQDWARVLIELGQLPEAERMITLRIEKNPQDASSWLLLGAIRQEMKNFKAASQAWQRFLKETEGKPQSQREREQAWLGLAQISIEEKNDVQAEQWLAQVGSGENTWRALLMRAAILGRQARLAEGRQLISSHPVLNARQERERTLTEAQYLHEFKQWQAAYEHLTVAHSELENADDDISYELALAAEKVDRLQEMETLLRDIMKRNPRYHHAYNALGFTLADRNMRLDEAKELIIKALELAPEEPGIIDSLGWVEFRLGRLKEAESNLRRAHEARPDAEIAAHWGEVLWAMGQKEPALAVWRRAIQMSADNETLRETLKRLGVQP